MPNPFTLASASTVEIQSFRDELRQPMAPDELQDWKDRFVQVFPMTDNRPAVEELKRQAARYVPTPEEYLTQKAEAAFDRQADLEDAEESPSRRYERPPSVQFLALREKASEATSPIMVKALLNQLHRQFSLDRGQTWYKDLEQTLVKKLTRTARN
jgi:hypothetical protein